MKLDADRFKRLGEQGELSFANGDHATGDFHEEEGRVWFRAIDGEGRGYETEEMPAVRLALTLLRYAEGTRLD